MEIFEQVPLREYTTLRLGGSARYFVAVHTLSELREALFFSEKHKLPIFILGGGSNTLFLDEGWPGLVIHMKLFGREYEEDSKGDVRVTVSAGEVWDQFVQETVAQGLWGIENLSRIPGTVGAAVVQNIGSYGVEIKEMIDWVEVLDITTKELHIFSATECNFGYRDSLFKHQQGKKYIVIRVAFRLFTTPKQRLAYKDLQEHFGDTKNITVQEVRNAIHNIREKKFPSLALYGTAGSFFKNPVITKTLHAQLETWFSVPVPCYEVDEEQVKIPLGWIFEKLGWKGKREGNFGCWKNQALVLVHYGEGTSSELILFVHKLSQEVKEKTSIVITPEVVFAQE